MADQPAERHRKAPTVPGLKTLTAPITICVSPETKGELTAWGETLDVAWSVVAREALAAGLAVMRARWAERAGAGVDGRLDARFLARHVAKAAPPRRAATDKR